jgi:hypothetical protein
VQREHGVPPRSGDASARELDVEDAMAHDDSASLFVTKTDTGTHIHVGVP